MTTVKILALLGTIAFAAAFPAYGENDNSGYGKSTGVSYVTVTRHETSKGYGNGGYEKENSYEGNSASGYSGGSSGKNEGGQSSYGKSEEGSSHQSESKNYGHEEKVVDYYAKPEYKFEYKVEDPHTGDVKSQKESRDGDKVEGVYELKEPDGTVLEVHYVADKKNGFNAEVVRKGKASHPQEYKKYESSKYESSSSY